MPGSPTNATADGRAEVEFIEKYGRTSRVRRRARRVARQPEPFSSRLAHHPNRVLERRGQAAERYRVSALSERSACSTARASSTRERRRACGTCCARAVSTVFPLRKSSAAIWGFVLRSTISRATSSSRRERRDAGASASPGRERLWKRRPRWRSSCSASRAGASSRRSRTRLLPARAGRGPFGLAGLGQRATGEGPRHRRVEDVPTPRGRRPMRAPAWPPRVAPSPPPARSWPRRERRSRWASAGRRGRPRLGGCGSALGVCAAPRLQLAARQELEPVGPPAARQQPQVLAADRRDHQLGSLRRPPVSSRARRAPTRRAR